MFVTDSVRFSYQNKAKKGVLSSNTFGRIQIQIK